MPPKTQNKQNQKPPQPQTQKKRNRKRRVVNNSDAAILPTKASLDSRTLASVEKSLKTVYIGDSKKGQGWQHCRLNPWSAPGGAMLPDSSNTRRLTVDYYSYTDISFTGTASFDLMTVPWMPYNALLKPQSGTTITVSGSNMILGTGSGGIVPSTMPVLAATGMIPINATKASWASSYVDSYLGTGNKSQIAANKARAISMAWRLTYTGQASSAQGTAVVCSVPMRFDDPFNKEVGSVIYHNSDNTVTGSISTASTRRMCMPFDYNIGAALGKDSIMARPEQGLRGLVRHSAPNYLWKDIRSISVQPVLLDSSINMLGSDVQSAIVSNLDANGVYAGKGTVNQGTIWFYDDEWESTVIKLTGVSGSFRFETWFCLEYIPDPDSTFSDFATVAKEINPKMIENTERMAAKMPLAVTSN